MHSVANNMSRTRRARRRSWVPLVSYHVALRRSIGDELDQTPGGKATWSIGDDHLCPPNLPGPTAGGPGEWPVRIPEYPQGPTTVGGRALSQGHNGGKKSPFADRP